MTSDPPSVAKGSVTAIVFAPPAGPRWLAEGFPPRRGFPVRAGRQIMAEDIDQKVIEIVSEQMGVDKSEITRETHFINDLNADSLDTVELVMEFEDEFELSIPDEEAEKIQTVGQAIDYIKQHGNK
jgi:acyl carrier protein